MKLRAVRRISEPSYPTQDYLTEHPELLRLVPRRWRNNHIVLAALGAAVAVTLSCRGPIAENKGAKPEVSRVAPLFIHGTGRAAFGCIAVNPPVLLSEDEARQVIMDEAKKAGLSFETDALTIKRVAVPVTNEFAFLDETPPEKPRTKVRNLAIDGYDRKHDVGFEIVSQEDLDEWAARDTRRMASVSEFDFEGTAKTLRAGLAEKKEQTSIGVFYEPATAPPADFSNSPKAGDQAAWKDYWENREKLGREIGEEQLRQQVRDFIQWLKAQGII